jgi:hypothetical protein
MKNNIIYFFYILIIEIGLLLQWFTLRRITILVTSFLLLLLSSFLVSFIHNIFVVVVISLINGYYIGNFIQWNFKKEDYEIIYSCSS